MRYGYVTPWTCLVLLCLVVNPRFSAGASEGDDVALAFARARICGSLRAAAIGGSITQGGDGWIAPWLRSNLPDVTVTMRNAGWSGTGSELGTFRLERDVIATDPGLVLIETAVNDGGLSDDEAIRCVESLVRRLVTLPQRPGIVMVLAAARSGANHRRHRAVAEHYGLLCVDLQAAMSAYVAAGGHWEDCFTDDVHLNATGNALYAQSIAEAIQPLLTRTPPTMLPPLPTPLAKLPLRLDGRMWTPGPAPGWTMRTQVGEWWDCFVLGSAEGRDPAQPLIIPVRGTAIGLHVDFGNGKECGTLLASVDGGLPTEVPGHLRGGGEALVLAKDLPAGEHRLALAVASYHPGPVRIAYVLAAGSRGNDAPPPVPGAWPAERLATLHLDPVPGTAFRLAGPTGSFTAEVDDPRTTFAKPLLPLNVDAYRGATVPGPNGQVTVRRGTAAPRLVFATTAPWRGEAVAVARFRSAQDHDLLLGLAADYFAQVRLNGTVVATLSSGHGGAAVHTFFPIHVHAGWNDLAITVLAGSRGHACDLLLEQPTDGITWETE